MTDRPAAAIVAVERQIDHKFKNLAVLISALTHPTALSGDRPGEDYQRLEFLGDRVLGVVVADMLLQAFPDADEGELSRRFADLVRKETCADIAAALKLGAAMITGGGKQQNAALRTRNVLGDICESVIAAIYLDGGFEAAQRFVETNWRERMMTRPSSRHNAKTELQEWAQSKGFSPPTYAIVGKSGPDHEPSFVIETKVDGLDPEIGEGGVATESRAGRRGPGPGSRGRMVATGVSNEIVTRCGFVALIGAPNAGKSTLINRFVGTKVSIVSRKVQTTRSLVRGIALAGQSQIILVDTPGIFEPRRRLDRAMVQTAWGGARDADIVALLVDATRSVDAEIDELLRGLATVKRPKILLLNKIDATKRDALLGLAKNLDQAGSFDRVFMISALNGDGVEDVTAYLADTLPRGPWLYGEDEVSDMPLRRLAAEITREKLFERLHQELPYQATVETEDWKELNNGSVRIEQVIIVGRESHKKIVIGKGGQAIKAVSTAARREIADIVDKPVHLFVFVKVREKWTDDPERYRQMGIEFPRD